MPSTQPVVDIALDLIDLEPQVRREGAESSVPELAQSIETVGQLAPVLVRKVGDRFKLIVGERRVRAMKLLNKPTIQAIVIDEELDACGILLRQFLENVQRENLNPIDEAVAIKQLMDSMKWSLSETREKLGLDPAALTRSLSLLTLNEPLRTALASGNIPASVGYELSKVSDALKQNDLARQYMDGMLNRDALSGLVKSQKRQPAPSASSPSRVIATIGPQTSLSIAAPNLDVEGAIKIVEEFLAKLRSARQKGITLRTLIAMLKDQAKA